MSTATIQKTNTAKYSRRSKCLHCDRLTVGRGLCRNCYGAYQRLVAQGVVTEQLLVQLGLMRPGAPWSNVASDAPRSIKAIQVGRLTQKSIRNTNAVLMLKYTLVHNN